ncbi:MAG TPA: type II toxin-antitoxin system HicA family toxin [Chryseolinea sp.]
MSKFKKAVERLKSFPTDFTWAELQLILRKLGYEEKKVSGSGRKFIHKARKHVISLHEPHPKPIMKEYALKIVIDGLKENGLL